MTLSHATQMTPTFFDAALNELKSTIKKNYENIPLETPFEHIEKE